MLIFILGGIVQQSAGVRMTRGQRYVCKTVSFNIILTLTLIFWMVRLIFFTVFYRVLSSTVYVYLWGSFSIFNSQDFPRVLHLYFIL